MITYHALLGIFQTITDVTNLLEHDLLQIIFYRGITGMEKKFVKTLLSRDMRTIECGSLGTRKWQDIQLVTAPQVCWDDCNNILSEPCNILQTLSKTKNFLTQTIKHFLRRGRLKISPNQVLTLMTLSTFLLLTELFQPITANSSLSASFVDNRLRVKRNEDAFRGRRDSQCERITIPSCIDIGYNMTDVQLSPSNMFRQEEAAESVS